MTRRGFTLIEISVALVIGGMALSAAVALMSALSERAGQLRGAGARVDADGNGERLLRSLVANLRFSTDSSRTLSGDSSSVTFLSSCETADGWLRPCRARIAARPDSNGFALTLLLNSGSSQTIDLVGIGHAPAAIRYLRGWADSIQWMTRWNEIVAPRAIELIAGTDSLLLTPW